MLVFDVFSDDAFRGTELHETVGDYTYIPQTLNQMNLFEVYPLPTTTVDIYKRGDQLEFVPMTERGSPRSLPNKNKGKRIQLETRNLRQEDRINSAELQGLVSEFMPFDVAFDRVDAEVEKRQRILMRKLEFTREYHRFAAVQGYLLDADGSVNMNYFDEFEVTPPVSITFALATMDQGALRTFITQRIYRPMMRQLRKTGRWAPGIRLCAFAGDNFFDALLQNPEFRKSFEVQQDGAFAREQMAFQTVTFAGVDWINFDGTSDNSSINISANQVKFFPEGAQDVFMEYRSPGEEMREVNQPAREFYAYLIPDVRAPVYMEHVDMYLDAHPLFACIAPDVLMTGQLA